MSIQVTLQFVTDEDADALQRFLDDVRTMLNSKDNEEGHMIGFRDFKYKTEPA